MAVDVRARQRSKRPNMHARLGNPTFKVVHFRCGNTSLLGSVAQVAKPCEPASRSQGSQCSAGKWNMAILEGAHTSLNTPTAL
jgi:hypothetical protein